MKKSVQLYLDMNIFKRSFDEMVTEKNYSPEQLRREAILILNKKLGALNTYRFLAQIGQNQEDYLKLQDRLFNGQSVDELYSAAKQHWQKRKRQK